MGETYRRTNITATLHWSGLYGGVAKLNPLLGEDTWENTKKHLKDPLTLRNKISILSIMLEGSQLCSSPAEYTIPKVKCAGSSLMLWSCFSAAGTEGLIRVEEKLNAPKYWDSLNENPVQSIQNLRLGRRFTFQHDNDPKHTTEATTGVA